MTVTLPKANLSWMDQLANAISPQSQETGSGLAGVIGYQPNAAGAFPPAPNSGGFLSQLIGKIPQNQFSVNPMLPTNVRLGG